MPHEIARIMEAAQATEWAIDPGKGQEIAAMLGLWAQGASPAWDQDNRQSVAAEPVEGRTGPIHVLRLHGAIVPRGNMLGRMSGAVSAEQFIKAFEVAASDTTARAIVMDVNSPGGAVEMIQEAASVVYSARKEGRPIIAVANTLAASAAYWIASAADEIAVTPSGRVGSIGVYTMHRDQSEAFAKAGIKPRFISAGPRKTEGNTTEPLGDAALRAVQSSVNETYSAFVKAVAKGRGVEASVVRADPESAERHFGGGRSYGAKMAVTLGMADREATLDQILYDLSRAPGSPRRDRARRRLALVSNA